MAPSVTLTRSALRWKFANSHTLYESITHYSIGMTRHYRPFRMTPIRGARDRRLPFRLTRSRKGRGAGQQHAYDSRVSLPSGVRLFESKAPARERDRSDRTNSGIGTSRMPPPPRNARKVSRRKRNDYLLSISYGAKGSRNEVCYADGAP